MIRYFVSSLALAVIMLPVGADPQSSNPTINATGNWNVNPSGEPLTSGRLRLRQDGSTVVGSYGQGGTLDGKFEPGTSQVDATWSDSRGKGWMTIVFTADGNRFSGEWGRPGSRPSGHFDAARATYPIVTGRYHVNVTGGTEFTTREITLRQLGFNVVGNYGPNTQLNGTMALDSNTLDGTWQGASGHGWIKLKFADDSKSFEGAWGLVAGTEPSGQMTGTTADIAHDTAHDTAQLLVRGLWDVASSGAVFATNALKFEQQGQTVTASYNGGHLQGTLPRGSHVLTGTWRDSRGTGNFTLKFASDGKSFQGTWVTKSRNNNGSIIGKRVIAAMQPFHQ